MATPVPLLQNLHERMGTLGLLHTDPQEAALAAQ